jgi:hypothetical protein
MFGTSTPTQLPVRHHAGKLCGGEQGLRGRTFLSQTSPYAILFPKYLIDGTRPRQPRALVDGGSTNPFYGILVSPSAPALLCRVDGSVPNGMDSSVLPGHCNHQRPALTHDYAIVSQWSAVDGTLCAVVVAPFLFLSAFPKTGQVRRPSEAVAGLGMGT